MQAMLDAHRRKQRPARTPNTAPRTPAVASPAASAAASARAAEWAALDDDDFLDSIVSSVRQANAESLAAVQQLPAKVDDSESD